MMPIIASAGIDTFVVRRFATRIFDDKEIRRNPEPKATRPAEPGLE